MTAFGERKSNERPRIVSVAFTGRCHACAAARAGVVAVASVLEAAAAGRLPFVPCRRCNAALQIEQSSASLDASGSSSSSVLARPASHSVAAITTPVPASLEAWSSHGGTERSPQVAARPETSSPSTPPLRFGRLVFITAAVGLAISLLIIGTMHATGVTGKAPRPVDAAIRPAGRSSGDVAEPRPESASVHLGAETVDISVSLFGVGSDSDVALARSKAIIATIDEMSRALPDAVRAANEAAHAPDTDGRTSTIEDRFTRDVGAFAGPERTSIAVERDAGLATVQARYRIARPAWDRAVAFYSKTEEAHGLTLARSLPNRRDGLVVVAFDARYEGLSQGAILVSFDHRAVSSADGFEMIRRPSVGKTAVFAVGSSSTTLTLK